MHELHPEAHMHLYLHTHAYTEQNSILHGFGGSGFGLFGILKSMPRLTIRVSEGDIRCPVCTS